MTWTAVEMMTVSAARALADDDVCFVGIGLPSAACNLARLTHAPRLRLVYESGTIETRPDVLPLSIGDGELCETALTTVSVPEMFQVLAPGRPHHDRLPRRRAGRSLRQLEQHGHRRLRPAGGAPARRRRGARDRRLLSTYLHRHATLPPGLRGPAGVRDDARARADRPERRALGLTTEGPALLVSDLCIMRPHPETKELQVTSLHPGVTREQVVEQTGWPVAFAGTVVETPAPTARELEVLRDLQARTAAAHGVAPAE